MVQERLATGPLPIALFSIPYCQQPCTQHPVTSPNPSHTLLPQMETLKPSLGPRSIYTWQLSLPSERQTSGRDSCSLQVIWAQNSEVLGTQRSRMEGFRLQVGISHWPHRLLAPWKREKAGPSKAQGQGKDRSCQEQNFLRTKQHYKC